MKKNIYTDLAVELHELVCEEKKQVKEEYEIDGVKVSVSKHGDSIEVTTVEVLDEMGEREIGKPIGNYVTIESKSMKENDIDIHESIISIMSKKLKEIYNIDTDSQILVVGLGNWNITPDALGPKVVSKVLVTRHIPEDLLPQESHKLRSVSAISPGVMGITGLETAEVVKGIVQRTNPDLIIAIDALASRSVSRINSTIQISDTGVSPGTGMGNRRMRINEENMGVPVIAIGVPTVVDAATLINDTMDYIIKDMATYVEKNSDFYKMLDELGLENRYPLIKDILEPYEGNMFVTPKEVDSVVDRISNIIANSINISLHKGITTDDINRYMY
ncbi:MAG: GPR endopeptidase [Defluviitaleaceae bacterium]|nr:GPR endopeptidase [Defluviitaleaceae bacterium]